MNRFLASCAALAAMCLLSGCSVAGTAVISQDDVVTINGSIREKPAADGTSATCQRMRSSGLGLLVAPDPLDANGTVGCQVTGTVGIQAFAWVGFGVGIAHTPDRRYTLLVPANLFGQASTTDSLDVEVTFPGAVLATDPAARSTGSVVRWTTAPKAGEGLSAISLDAGDLAPGSALGLALAGGLLGGLVTSLTFLTLRRAARRGAGADAEGPAAEGPAAQPDADAVAEVAAPDVAAPDPSVWAPDADR